MLVGDPVRPEVNMPENLSRWGAVLFFLLVPALGPAGCVSVPASPERAAVTVTAEPGVSDATPDRAGAGPQGIDLSLPRSFHYAVDIGPGDASEAAATQITGTYHNGDWSQTTRLEDPSGDQSGAAEESLVVGGTNYTRPAGETQWTRWPSLGFEASYGLVSPFTVLRLYALADQRTDRVADLIAGAPAPTFKIQASISPETVKEVLSAGISAVAADDETRSALEAQVAPLAVGQTITYWVGEDGRVYRAAATLLAADETGQPAPWLQAAWRFWGYDDPAIAIQAPADSQEASVSGPSEQPVEETAATSTPGASGNLVVNVFSAPGIPAKKLGVTVYSSGDTGQPLDWRTDPTAEFSLPPGSYDILVQMDYAQEWLRTVPVALGETTARDVVFDFGTLEIAAVRNGAPAPVEMVVYPAGDHENWVDWRSENPATISLRAGEYDVEIVAPGQDGVRRMLPGVVIRAGETRKETVELNP
jgi:hypothetical protein